MYTVNKKFKIYTCIHFFIDILSSNLDEISELNKDNSIYYFINPS